MPCVSACLFELPLAVCSHPVLKICFLSNGQSHSTAGSQNGSSALQYLLSCIILYVGRHASANVLCSACLHRELDKAARALDWERKSLAAQLKWNLTEGEREELFREWDVDVDKKERKLQLVFKLWSPETVR